MKSIKGKKLIYVILIIILFSAWIVKLISRSESDKALMEKMIAKQIKTKKPVILYNLWVLENYRLAGYVIGDEDKYEKFSFVVFNLNQEGDYEIIDVIEPYKTINEAADITVYEFSQIKIGDFLVDRQLAIMNNNPNLSKVELIVENGESQIQEVYSIPEVIIFEDLDENWDLEYKLYDKYGNTIN